MRQQAHLYEETQEELNYLQWIPWVQWKLQSTKQSPGCWELLLKIFNSYLTRLSKISWFVNGKQINYLPKPKPEANNWSARHWQIKMLCCKRVQLLFYRSITKFVFIFQSLWQPREAICLFFTQEPDYNYAWVEYYLQKTIYSKTLIMILRMSRPSLVGISWVCYNQRGTPCLIVFLTVLPSSSPS